MKIGIIGVGLIGRTLTQKLSATGHDVKAANSRGPETIEPEVFSSGGRAVSAEAAVHDVEVLILSIPLMAISAVAPIVANARAETTIIDTSNYYPGRDGRIDAIEAGQVESVWVSEQLGRPVVKAWNAIVADSLAKKGKPAGSKERLAVPVAADDFTARRLGIALVEDTGFDGFDAGGLNESWRQQPGAPCYCTDLILEELPGALAAADRSILPERRDLAISAITERLGDPSQTIDSDFLVPLNRSLYM